MLPREHGAWAVMAVPILVGFAAAGGGPPAILTAFAAAALGGFCLRAPLASLASGSPDPRAWRWLAAYAAAAGIGGARLILFEGRPALLAFAAPALAMLGWNIRCGRTRRAFSMPNEAAGVLTLSLGAPAAYYAARGLLPHAAWLAWAACAAYFLGPVFHVKMAALQHRAAADAACLPAWRRMRGSSVAYHAASLAAVAAAAAWGPMPWAAALPFAAALHKTWRRAVQSPARVDFRGLGYGEVGYACFFLLAAAAGFLPAGL